MSESWREWLRPTHSNPFFTLAVVGSLALLALPFLIRCRATASAGGRSTFRADGEAWKMIGVVLLATALALALARKG